MYRLMKHRKPTYYIQNLQDEMNRIIEDAFGEFETPELSIEREEKTWRPAVEMCEHDNEYQLKAALPGIKKENINVEINEDSITLKAETEHKKQEEKENLYKSEFRYGKFIRTIAFPSQVKSEEAHAEYKDGILHITVPKAVEEGKKPRMLEIHE